MDQVTLVKNQYRLEQWTRLIQDCQSSGMRVDDWCEANGVILSIMVDTFISKISLPMQQVPEIGSISVA